MGLNGADFIGHYNSNDHLFFGGYVQLPTSKIHADNSPYATEFEAQNFEIRQITKFLS